MRHILKLCSTLPRRMAQGWGMATLVAPGWVVAHRDGEWPPCSERRSCAPRLHDCPQRAGLGGHQHDPVRVPRGRELRVLPLDCGGPLLASHWECGPLLRHVPRSCLSPALLLSGPVSGACCAATQPQRVVKPKGSSSCPLRVPRLGQEKCPRRCCCDCGARALAWAA